MPVNSKNVNLVVGEATPENIRLTVPSVTPAVLNNVYIVQGNVTPTTVVIYSATYFTGGRVGRPAALFIGI